MIHTYYVRVLDYDDYNYLDGIITKAQNIKEALIKLNNRFPLLKLKEYDIQKLNKTEIISFYNI